MHRLNKLLLPKCNNRLVAGFQPLINDAIQIDNNCIHACNNTILLCALDTEHSAYCLLFMIH